MLIIFCIRWTHELAALIPEDRALLEENSVCVEVRRPLWLAEDEDSASLAAPILPVCD